jgi:hypothetical protein
VLPILHLNGYKIANPTVLARITHEELEQFLRGCGWTPIFVEGHEPGPMHTLMAAALDQAVLDIQHIQRQARQHGQTERPHWPMIVLNSPKGWAGRRPAVVRTPGTAAPRGPQRARPWSDPATLPHALDRPDSWSVGHVRHVCAPLTRRQWRQVRPCGSHPH